MLCGGHFFLCVLLCYVWYCLFLRLASHKENYYGSFWMGYSSSMRLMACQNYGSGMLLRKVSR